MAIETFKFRKTFIWLYAYMVTIICITSYFTPAVAKHFLLNILMTSLMMLTVSIYLIDFKFLRAWFRQRWFIAKARAQLRKDIREKAEKALRGY